MATRAPMPPLPLANRVGSLAEAEDPFAFYEEVGADTRKQILRMLPPGYELEGRRLLDFGCGAGRTLRHFLDEASSAEIWGCDIDAESIDWLERNLCPPLHVVRNEAAPGLPFEDGHFDLIWALSVFTHLADDAWAAWLLELHRVLGDDGILIATTLGSRHSARFAQEPWEEDRIGMNTLRSLTPWAAGGPVVLHSTWWLRAHWGRAFEILEIDESPVAFNQRWLAMRKRDVTLTVEDLERPEPGEPRELTAVRHHVRQLVRELERSGEQEELLRTMLGSRAFAVAEHLSRLRQGGRPAFSRQQIRRALGEEDGPRPSSFRKPLPGMDNRRVGQRYLHWFVELAGLTPDEAVLEPGCGSGRMAEPLSGWLSATGSYDGFDIVSEAIEWCERNIASKHPNFRFRHVDVLNPAFNPEGELDPEEFEFPYPEDSFDFAFLTSVFTHMLPPEVRHYLGEIRRVLRPGGRCLMTFFLLNEKSLDSVRAGTAARRFAYEGEGYFYDVPDQPERAVAYREEDLLALLDEAGFELHVPVRYGTWTSPRDRRRANVGQDIVVVRPRD